MLSATLAASPRCSAKAVGLFVSILLQTLWEQVHASFMNKDVEGASLWFDGKQQWMDGDWKVGQVRVTY